MIAVILAAGRDTVAHRRAQARGPAGAFWEPLPARDSQ